MRAISTVGMDNFEEEGAAHCTVYGHSAVNRAKTAEPIEMLFGIWARVGPMKHILHRLQIPMGRGNFEGKGTASCKV